MKSKARILTWAGPTSLVVLRCCTAAGCGRAGLWFGPNRFPALHSTVRQGLGLTEQHVPSQLRGPSLPYSHGTPRERAEGDGPPRPLRRWQALGPAAGSPRRTVAEGGSRDATELCAQFLSSVSPPWGARARAPGIERERRE